MLLELPMFDVYTAIQPCRLVTGAAASDAWQHHEWCLSELKRLGFSMPKAEPKIDRHDIYLKENNNGLHCRGFESCAERFA